MALSRHHRVRHLCIGDRAVRSVHYHRDGVECRRWDDHSARVNVHFRRRSVDACGGAHLQRSPSVALDQRHKQDARWVLVHAVQGESRHVFASSAESPRPVVSAFACACGVAAFPQRVVDCVERSRWRQPRVQTRRNEAPIRR
eukprot:Amastigsp_a676780_96.p6 type:complete len:143 gc:universal Amastigsp_a676780_96:1911-1483(-)